MKNKFQIVCIACFILSCGNRTPSIERFSKRMDITIPENAVVTKDEYQDMLQDFVILYELKLTETNSKLLVNNIKKSHFYNNNLNINNTAVSENDYIKINEIKGLWKKTLKGYEFKSGYGRHMYSAQINTINLIAKFQESYD